MTTEPGFTDILLDSGIYRELEGTVDMHVHTHPDFCARLLDDHTLVSLAKAVKMRAVMIKSHAGSTAERAYIAEKSVGGGINVFGLICLNPSVGGFNPAAVAMALRAGVRGVWMPSMWAENHSSYVRAMGQGMGYQTIGMDFPGPGEGLSILDGSGVIKPELLHILDIVAKADVMLATGHLTLKEAHILLAEAKRREMKKLVVHTVNYHVMRYPLADLITMVREYGAVLEMGFSSLPNGVWDPLDHARLISLQDVAEIIRQVGSENCLLTTDCGQFSTPMPIEAMRLWIDHMKTSGFNKQDIDNLTKHVPARMLGLEPRPS